MEIFNEEYYKFTYPEYKKFSHYPLLHYIKIGWKNGFNPSPQFNTTFFLANNPDIKNIHLSPIEYYEQNKGMMPIFPNLTSLKNIPAWLASHLKDICYYYAFQDGLFDPHYYLQTNQDLKNIQSAVRHFQEFGWKEKRNPSAAFNLEEYETVFLKASMSSDPIIQIEMNSILKGIQRGENKEKLEKDAIKKEIFDPKYYTSIYTGVEKEKAFGHYLALGSKIGLNPSRNFNTFYYIEQYPEAAENPIKHFLENTDAEKEKKIFPDIPDPLKTSAAIKAHIGDITAYMAIENGLWDDEWYSQTYPDIKGISPLNHYRKFGCFENRNPSGKFDCASYARAHLGNKTNIPALWHFFQNSFTGNVNVDIASKIQLEEENDILLEQIHSLQIELTKLHSRLKNIQEENKKELSKKDEEFKKEIQKKEEEYKIALNRLSPGLLATPQSVTNSQKANSPLIQTKDNILHPVEIANSGFNSSALEDVLLEKKSWQKKAMELQTRYDSILKFFNDQMRMVFSQNPK